MRQRSIIRIRFYSCWVVQSVLNSFQVDLTLCNPLSCMIGQRKIHANGNPFVKAIMSAVNSTSKKTRRSSHENRRVIISPPFPPLQKGRSGGISQAANLPDGFISAALLPCALGYARPDRRQSRCFPVRQRPIKVHSHRDQRSPCRPFLRP